MRSVSKENQKEKTTEYKKNLIWLTYWLVYNYKNYLSLSPNDCCMWQKSFHPFPIFIQNTIASNAFVIEKIFSSIHIYGQEHRREQCVRDLKIFSFIPIDRF
jgi:hypothetical protein